MYDENAAQIMALANLMNVKDSRWLQLEVCREFQRGSCSRSETECKFSHPPPHVEVQNGRVTACYDSIKGRCTRENPKCKYLHPPQHLKDQLLINGRNNLAVKNLVMNHLAAAPLATAAPLGVSPLTMTSGGAFVPGVAAAYSPYAAYTLNPAVSAVYPNLMTSQDMFSSMGGMLPTAGTVASPAVAAAAMALQAQQKAVAASVAASTANRADRVEVCREFTRGTCQRTENECKYAHPQPTVDRTPDGYVTVCMEYVRSNGAACAHSPCRYFHPPPHLWPGVNNHALGAQGTGSSSIASTIGALQASAYGVNMAGAGGQRPHLQQNVCLPVSARNGIGVVTSLSNGDTGLHHQHHLHQSPGPGTAGVSGLPVVSAAAAAAAASMALNAPVNKRVAFEKSGIPVYQPVTHVPAVSIPTAAHAANYYPQLTAIPGLQASYLPLAFAGHPTGLQRF